MVTYSSTFFVALLCFGHIQSKNKVTPLEVSIFQKSAKTEVKNVWLTKIEKRPILYLILAVQASNFYHGCYNAMSIFSPNKDAKLVVSIFLYL